MIIADYVKLHAEKYPNKMAIAFNGLQLTYAELAQKIEQLTYYIEDCYKLVNQSRVILFAHKSIDFVVCYFALHKLNVIVVPIDVEVPESTFLHICQETEPSLVIGDNVPKNYVGHFVSFKDLAFAYTIKYFDVPIVSRSLGSIADIMFTSGTTGKPKGVMLSHENLLFSAMHIANFVGNSCEDVEVLALPLCHSFGLGRLRSIFYVGGALVLYNGFFNVKGLFQTMQNYAVTGFSMVPASWKILEKLSGTKISMFSSTLRYIEFGSAHLLSEDKQKLLKLLPETKLCMHYGLTEASRSLFMEFHVDPLDCIGYISDGIEVKIMNENGEEITDNSVGEICVKGKNLTIGYWNDDNMFKSMLYGEYFRTGDVGYRDGKYFYLTARLKDIVNVGGKKVSAVEVENIAKKYTGVEDCACVGIFDSVLGEQIKLFIVTSNKAFDLSSLKEYLGCNLENYKVPHYYEVVENLPKTLNGKVKKYLLK